MSVWAKISATSASLSGREGDLISVSIDVDPRYLELLLETLAQVGFPVNPQIYHDAAIVYLHPDGREETEATTLVEFPAYGNQLEAVRAALESQGFDPASLQVTGMLEEIQSESPFPAPLPGVDCIVRHRVKHRLAGAH